MFSIINVLYIYNKYWSIERILLKVGIHLLLSFTFPKLLFTYYQFWLFSLNFLKKGLKQNKFVVTWLVYALKNFEVIAKAAKWREWVVGQS